MPRRAKTAPRRAPRQKRSAETIDVLLTATERVLGKDGFAAATTNRIAEAAGVSIGTLYHYFPTKEALIEALVHRMWADELRIMESHAGALDAGPLAVAVRRIVDGLVAIVRRRQELYKRWFAEASHLGQLSVGLEMADRAIAMLRASLERRRGELRPANVAFAADFVIKMALAAVRTAARDYPAELASGELSAAVADMLTRYLVKDA
jgi:AcrR family transcriptional regulator